MARTNNKMSKRRSAKIEPAELTINLNLPAHGAQGSSRFIDLSQISCLLNRRFYRQGLNWAVSGFTLHNLTGSAGSLQISKLPSTWTMFNAWKKGLDTWTTMNDDALEHSESLRPRFLDFKIHADVSHQSLGFGENLLPFVNNALTGAVEEAVSGEWESSKIFIPIAVGAAEGATVENEIIAVGASYPGAAQVVSLVEGYAASRLLPNILDPNTPGDADDTDNVTPENWMVAVFNEGTEQTSDVIAELTTENNVAPYPFEGGPNPATPGVPHPDTMYPGGANQLGAMILHDQLNVTTTTVSNRVSGKGGMFPCGLIRIKFDDTFANNLLQIHLVPGSHRGLLAGPMTEM